jgi:hypothetical protein
MKKIKAKIKSLKKEVDGLVKVREQYFITKPESWQDSITGDRYDVKTGILRELSEALGEQLSNF